MVGFGGLVAGSGALVGTGALDAFQAQREANIPVTTDSQALVAIEVPPDQQSNEIIQETGDTVGIDFTAPSNSDGVQPEATYQLGGMDVSGESRIQTPLQNDNVAKQSGFPSPIGGGTVQFDPAIHVRNNSTEKLGITAEFDPNDNFPSDGRVFIVMHDVGQAQTSGGNDIRSELYGPNGLGQSEGTEYRPVYPGEALAVSMWIYTGGTGNQNPDLSGELLFTAQDADDVSVGQD